MRIPFENSLKPESKKRKRSKSTPAEQSIGQRFGRLVVTAILGRNHRSQAIVQTVCDCGDTHIAMLYHLRRPSHATKSCGCLSPQNLITIGCESWNRSRWSEDVLKGADNLITTRINKYGWEPQRAITTQVKLRSSHPRLLTFNGRELPISTWAFVMNIPAEVIRSRIFKYNWSVPRALSTPLLRQGGRK